MKKNKTIFKLNDYDLNDPQKKKTCNQIMFKEIAPKYNLITRVLSFNMDAFWKRKLTRRLPSMDKAVCLDLACGTGDISFLLARKYRSGRIMAMDLSVEMLDRARAANKYHNISFLKTDMCRPGLKPGLFDVITGGYALRNAPSLERVIGNVYNLLKPGGRAVFLDFAKNGHKYIQMVQLYLLKTWGRIWGQVLHGNPDIYGYIAESLKIFPDNAGLQHLLVGHGFRDVRIIPMFLGMMSLIVFKK